MESQTANRHAGQKVLTLQTLPPAFEPPANSRIAQASGFSLHAGIAIGGAAHPPGCAQQLQASA